MGVCRNKTGRSLAPAATLPPSMVQAFQGGAVEDLRLQRDDVRFFVGVPVNPRRTTESDPPVRVAALSVNQMRVAISSAKAAQARLPGGCGVLLREAQPEQASAASAPSVLAGDLL